MQTEASSAIRSERVEPVRSVLTVGDFCAAYRISRAKLYSLWQDNLGPARFKVGARTYITVEAAERWLRSVELGNSANV